MKKLNLQALQEHMKTIDSSWVLKESFLQIDLVFTDFVQAFAFITAVADAAEKAHHHPNWENVYNKVSIALSTHDADGITQKDFQLATEIDHILQTDAFKNQ